MRFTRSPDKVLTWVSGTLRHWPMCWLKRTKTARDPGPSETLSLYAEWRRHDQQAVALMTDSLVRLFANPLLPIRIARDIRMLALDLASPAKHFLTRQFMGISGRLPRLAQGLGLEC